MERSYESGAGSKYPATPKKFWQWCRRSDRPVSGERRPKPPDHPTQRAKHRFWRPRRRNDGALARNENGCVVSLRSFFRQTILRRDARENRLRRPGAIAGECRNRACEFGSGQDHTVTQRAKPMRRAPDDPRCRRPHFVEQRDISLSVRRFADQAILRPNAQKDWLQSSVAAAGHPTRDSEIAGA